MPYIQFKTKKEAWLFAKEQGLRCTYTTFLKWLKQPDFGFVVFVRATLGLYLDGDEVKTSNFIDYLTVSLDKQLRLVDQCGGLIDTDTVEVMCHDADLGRYVPYMAPTDGFKP